MYNYFLGNQNAWVHSKPMFGVNVRNAREGEFPFVSHFCSGVLITRQDILTSAHCTENEHLPHIWAIIGSSDLRQGTRYSLLWWITYNRWIQIQRSRRRFQINDIANIRVSFS
jgi:secreted trypsin-like serine protease